MGSIMAKQEVRVVVKLECQECKNWNYSTTKNKRNDPDRITKKKFCPTCRKHQPHREER
jgi:large subunit ribosomal protein L33